MERGVILKFDFLIIGKDKRLAYMANFLAYKNFKVLAYDLDCTILNKKIKRTNSMKCALKNSKNVICPIPFTQDFIYLNSKNKKIYIKEILENLSGENRVFGGEIPKKFLDYCNKKNIFVYDYLKNEKFVVFNSILTAEAAVASAILKNPKDMHFSNCLVLGFGNCGKLICNKLKNLCFNVFVCVEDELEKAWAKAYGFLTFKLDSLRFKIERFNYIFNTIPKNIFCKEVLINLNENALIFDIANSLTKKKEYVNYSYISGIPGKFKAKSSAEILVDLTLKEINKIKNKK